MMVRIRHPQGVIITNLRNGVIQVGIIESDRMAELELGNFLKNPCATRPGLVMRALPVSGQPFPYALRATHCNVTMFTAV